MSKRSSKYDEYYDIDSKAQMYIFVLQSFSIIYFVFSRFIFLTCELKLKKTFKVENWLPVAPIS